MRRRLVLLAASLLALTGCAAIRQTGSGGPTGVVKGDVLAGPTCPVETSDGAGCDPVPVVGEVQFWQDGENVGEVSIRIDGTFSVNVPVGTYTVKVVPASTNSFPTCADSSVTVTEQGNHELHLECDTGIR